MEPNKALGRGRGVRDREGMTAPPLSPSVKARRFSLQHNRIVKRDSSSSEDEDWGPPKPFYQLMAEKAGSSPDLASLLPPLRD